MKPIDMIIIGVIVLAVAGVSAFLVYRKRKTGSACGCGGCDGCSGCSGEKTK